MTDHFEDGINHVPVAVPKHSSPFENWPDLHEAFTENLELLVQGETSPPGFGLLPEEWGEEGYPPVEPIPYGRRGGTKDIPLPDQIWCPRAVLWGQALFVLNALQYHPL